MRQTINIVLLFFISCSTPNEKVDKSYYVESKLSFYDPYDDSFTSNKWIRKPENIRIAHESFKAFGYENIFSDKELYESPCWIPGLNEGVRNKTCRDVIDSLIIWYPSIDKAPKYYREFWMRRKNEKNDSTVYSILIEIKAGLFERRQMSVTKELVNDTIVNLLKILKEPATNETAPRHFDYLRAIGLHSSAYNLLYESYKYYDIKWDREKLKKGLKNDTIKCCPWAVFEDDTK